MRESGESVAATSTQRSYIVIVPGIRNSLSRRAVGITSLVAQISVAPKLDKTFRRDHDPFACLPFDRGDLAGTGHAATWPDFAQTVGAFDQRHTIGDLTHDVIVDEFGLWLSSLHGGGNVGGARQR